MKKWEYKYCTRFQDLAQLGEEGWELVCVDNTNFYLKREL